MHSQPKKQMVMTTIMTVLIVLRGRIQMEDYQIKRLNLYTSMEAIKIHISY